MLPHENTMAGPVSDRLALYTAVDADLEPIFLLYDGGGAASRAVAEADRAEPLVDVELPDGLRHRLWALTDHDRAARGRRRTCAGAARPSSPTGTTATRPTCSARPLRHEAGDGAGPWDSGLTFLVDASAFGPEVHAIHRVVPGQDAAELAALAARGATRARPRRRRPRRGAGRARPRGRDRVRRSCWSAATAARSAW